MAVRKIVSEITGKATWQIDYLEPDGKRVRKNFKTKKKADAEHAKRISLKAEGRYLDVKKDCTATLKELADLYEKNFKHQSSWADKNRYIKNFLDEFGEKILLDQIRYVDVETYKTKLMNKPTRKILDKKAKLKKPRTTAAVNREMSCVRHMFKKAVEWEMLEQSPFGRGKSLHMKENNQRLRFLAEEEIDLLLEKCPAYLYDIVECALNTGMRRGELLSLKWDQVRNGFIYLDKTKTDEARQIPINDTLAELFKRIRKVQQLKSEYVFLFQGAPVADVKVGLKAALKNAGITDFTFHDLRHTFASHMVMRGATLKDVQEILGHKTIQMTMRYAHLSQEHKKKAVKLIDGLTASTKKKKSMSRIVTNLENKKAAGAAK